MYEAAQARATELVADKEFIQVELDSIASEHNSTMAKIEMDFLSKISEKDMQLEKLIDENNKINQRIKELECEEKEALILKQDYKELVKIHDKVRETADGNEKALAEQKKTEANLELKLIDLTCQVKKTEATKNLLENTVEQQSDEIDRLKVKLDEAVIQIVVHKHAKEELEKEVANLDQEKASFEEQIREINANAEAADADRRALDEKAMIKIGELMHTLDLKNEEINRLHSHLDEASTACEVSKATLLAFQAKLDEATAEIKTLHSRLKIAAEEREKAVADLQSTKVSFEEQIRDINANAEAADADRRALDEKATIKIDELTRTLDLKNDEINRLQSHLDEASTACEVSKATLLAFQAKLDEATAEIKTLHSRLQIAAEEREKAAADLQSTKASFEEQIRDINANAEAADADRRALDEKTTIKIDELTHTLDLKNEEINRLQSHLDEASTACEVSKATLLAFQAKLDEATAEIKTLHSRLQTAAEEREKAAADLQSTKASFEEQIRDINANAEAADADRRALDEKTTIKIDELTHTLDLKNDEINRLQSHLDEASTACEVSKATLLAFQAELDEATAEIKTLHSRLQIAAEEREKALADLQSTKASFEEQIRDINANAKAADADRRALDEKAMIKIDELTRTLDLKNEEINRLQSHLDEASTACEVSKVTLLVFQAKLDEATAEIKTLHSRLEIAAEEREKAAADLQSTKASFEEQIRDINANAEAADADRRALDEKTTIKIDELTHTLDLKNEEINRLHSHLDEASVACEVSKATLLAFQAKLDEATAEIKTLHSRLKIAAEEREKAVADLQSTKVSFEEQIRDINANAEAADADRRALDEKATIKIDELTRTLDLKNEEINRLQSHLDKASTACEVSKATLLAFQAKLDEATAEIKTLHSRLQIAAEEREKAAADLQSTKESFEEQIRDINANAEAADADRRALDEKATIKIDELTHTLDLKNEEINRLQSHLDEASTACEVSKATLLVFQAKLDEATAEIKTLHSRLEIAAEEREKAAADLQSTKASFEEQIRDINANAEAADADRRALDEKAMIKIDELTHTLDLKNEEINRLQSHLDEASTACEVSKATLLAFQAKLDEATAENKTLHSRLEFAAEEREKAAADHQSTQSILQETTMFLQKILEKTIQLLHSIGFNDGTIAASTVKLEKTDIYGAENTCTMTNANYHFELLTQLQDRFAAILEDRNQTVVELKHAEETIRDLCLQNSRRNVSQEAASVASLNSVTKKLETARVQINELSNEKVRLELKTKHLDELREATVALFEATIAEKAGFIEKLQTQVYELQRQTKDFQGELTTSNVEKNELKILAEDLANKLQSAEAQAQKFEQLESCSILNNLRIDLEKANAELLSLQSKQLESEKEENSVRVKLQDSEETLSRLIEEQKIASMSYDDQVLDLNRLLADSLVQISEARDAATASEKEVEEKQRELDEALSRCSDYKSAVEALQTQLSKIPETNEKDCAYEELMQDLELLMEEKLEVQDRLEKELRDRRDFENSLRKQMGEEQRLLVSEAEAAMQTYKNQLAEYKENNRLLAQEVRELHHQKEALEGKARQLHDDFKALELKHVELNSETSILERRLEESQAGLIGSRNMLEKLAVEYDEFRRQTHLSNRELIERHENDVVALRNEIDIHKQALSVTESERNTSRSEVNALQDHVRQLKVHAHSEKQSVSREAANSISLLKVKVSEVEGLLSLSKNEACSSAQKAEFIQSQYAELELKFKRKEEEAFALTNECHQLKIRLRSLSKECNMNKENENSRIISSEVQELSREISRLQEEITLKDSRIKKLDAVKMTKEQCAALKRMKDERLQFMKQAQDLAGKLKAAENEMLNLRSKLEEKLSSSPSRAEISELQEIKEALGTKLRKYAAHIKQMDQERSLAFHAMKKVSDVLDEDDFVGSVTALCEKFMAIEEECDALGKVEGRANSYLLEAEQLRDTNGALKMKLAESENQLKELLKAKANLQLKLEESSHALVSLQGEIDELKTLENLAKGDFSKKESEKSRQISYLEKENLQLMLEIKNIKKEAQNLRLEIETIRRGSNQEITEDLKGFSSELLAANLFDKENIISGHQNSSAAAVESAGKKSPTRKVQCQVPLSCSNISVAASGKKTSTLRAHSQVPELGQSSIDDDATGECKQS